MIRLIGLENSFFGVGYGVGSWVGGGRGRFGLMEFCCIVVCFYLNFRKVGKARGGVFLRRGVLVAGVRGG